MKKSTVKSAKSDKKSKSCDSSEFQVMKGRKSKSSSCAFSVKISNRFEVLLRDGINSIADGITELEERKITRELIPRRMEKDEKKENLLTKGAFDSNQLTSSLVESTDAYKSNKVFFYFYNFLAKYSKSINLDILLLKTIVITILYLKFSYLSITYCRNTMIRS